MDFKKLGVWILVLGIIISSLGIVKIAESCFKYYSRISISEMDAYDKRMEKIGSLSRYYRPKRSIIKWIGSRTEKFFPFFIAGGVIIFFGIAVKSSAKSKLRNE